MLTNQVLLVEEDVDGMVFCKTVTNGAIQVVESIDEVVQEGDEEKTKKVIKIIKKYKNGPSLEDILLHEDNKDLTILVFSITGKTRGGKSFLLNMMIKYLESQKGEDWLLGNVPSQFAWGEGVDSITKGVWLWPKIYKLMDCHRKNVGILLMDNSGMFDGELTDGEVIAISGISTVISYLQMFNIEKKITNDNLECVVRNLVKGIETMDPEQSEELKQDYKLMFLVRDWIGGTKYGYGKDSGKKYIETESQRGTYEYRCLWRLVAETFNDVHCAVLPFPGSAALTPEFTSTGDLSVLESLFREEVKKFIENLFSPINLIPPEKKLTGQAIYNLLLTADGREADASLAFMNIFTDHANFDKVEKLKADFDSKLLEIDDSELHKAKAVMDDILNIARRVLKGNSAPELLVKLKKTLEEKVNKKVTDSVLKSYEESFQCKENIVAHQSAKWPEILCKLQILFCGSGTIKVEAYENAAQKAAEIYYRQLHKKLAADFETKCAEKDLDDLAGLDVVTLENEFIKCTDFGNLAGDHAAMQPIWLKQRCQLKDDLITNLLQRIETITGVSVEWLRSARSKQYEYFEAFTLLKKRDDNWDIIPTHDEKHILKKKVGFAIFGPSSRYLDTFSARQSVASGTDYSAAEEKIIELIVNKIVSLSDPNEIKFSCIFLTLKKGNENTIDSVPLFRIQTAKYGIQYVDTNCWVYQWEDFLLSNTLPDTIYCYPLHGSYDKKSGFNVAYAKTPSSQISSKTLEVTDVTGKVLLHTAGAAGCAVLVLGAAGIALPFVGGAAIIGGGIAGAYGAVRNGVQLYKKHKHCVPVSAKDVLSLGSNTLAVVGMGAGAVAEGALIIATKAAQFWMGINAFTQLFQSNNTPDLMILLGEISANTFKILFYFNASSIDDAFEIIQENLKMPGGSSTVEIVEKLLDINSVQSADESKGVSKTEKYISAGITKLVKNLLGTVRPDFERTLLLYLEIGSVHHELISERKRSQSALEQINKTMSELYEKLKRETKCVKKRVTKLVRENNFNKPDITNNFIEELNHGENTELVLILRVLVSSISFRMRKANQFYNSIEHNPIRLHGYDVEYHPLQEVIEQIRNTIEQNKSKMDLSSEDSTEHDKFIGQVLNLLWDVAKPDWKSQQFSQCLLTITRELMNIFNDRLESHERRLKEKIDPTCSDLEFFFFEIGLVGNYGSWLLKDVLDSYKVDQNCRTECKSQLFVILPAWFGILDRFFVYSSDTIIASKKDLVKYMTQSDLENYDTRQTKGNHVTRLVPGEDSLPTYLIYSTKGTLGIESGLIWSDKIF